MREVVMPKSSMTMTEGELTKWLVGDGEQVGDGDPIAIIQTDKVEMEVEAPSDGRVGILLDAPANVPVGEVICVILAEGESKPAPEAAPAPAEAVEVPDAPEEPERAPDLGASGAGGEGAAPDLGERGGKVRASPAARAMAKRLGVDISAVRGSGPRGRVRPADVASHAEDARPRRERAQAPRSEDEGGILERYRPTGIRGVMARRMEVAAGIPQFTLFADIALAAADRGRKLAGDGIGLTDVVTKAVALALREHPILNSHWADGEIITYSSARIGLAVDTDDGLVVPVLPDVGSLPLADLAARRKELVAAAQLRRLRPEEASGATFTITNLGGFHVRSFQAVVDPPQVGILSIGAARSGAGSPATFGLSADHRVVDGAEAARFLETLRDILEYPRTIFETA